VSQTKFKQILAIGLGNIVSGMLFGTGCLIVEHIDESWSPADNIAQAEDKTTPTKMAKSANASAVSNDRLALSPQQISKLKQYLDNN
jgi:hypothetical protein